MKLWRLSNTPDYCSKASGNCSCLRDFSFNADKQRKIKNIVITMRELGSDHPVYRALLKTVKDLRGEWYINSIKHDFCFWSYMQDNYDKKHTLEQCGDLIDMSVSGVANIERKALRKLRNVKEVLR